MMSSLKTLRVIHENPNLTHTAFYCYWEILYLKKPLKLLFSVKYKSLSIINLWEGTQNIEDMVCSNLSCWKAEVIFLFLPYGWTSPRNRFFWFHSMKTTYLGFLNISRVARVKRVLRLAGPSCIGNFQQKQCYLLWYCVRYRLTYIFIFFCRLPQNWYVNTSVMFFYKKVPVPTFLCFPIFDIVTVTCS